jgi:hypothetical protein
LLTLSKKQIQLYRDITTPDIPNISVLGSTQSGKTYDICLALIEYARKLRAYEREKRKEDGYIKREYIGAIVGWTTDTVKSNIVDNLTNILENVYKFRNGKEYVLKYGQQDKYLQIYDMKFYFFGFNNKLSFNRILGKPLIFCWVDESARIYSNDSLQESFDEFPGRMMSYAGHPFYKRIDSFNVEGNSNHPYKVKYIDNTNWKKYTFFPYDNPVLDTEEKIREAVKTFPKGSLREQKVFNKWVVAEGKVFNKINKLKSLEGLTIREIGIGIDYGSVNPTTFVPIALCFNENTRKWQLVRLQIYYHDPKVEQDNPTTEFYSLQLRLFLLLLKDKYPTIPISEIVIDSEASHFDNRLITDGIRHTLSKKGAGSVDSGVQYMQSLFHKDYLYILEEPSIRYFTPDGHYEESVKDEGLIELESYQYDNARSVKTGMNCYKKDLDHSIDATRYLLEEFKATNRSPVV